MVVSYFELFTEILLNISQSINFKQFIIIAILFYLFYLVKELFNL